MNWEESQQEWTRKYEAANSAVGFFSVNGLKGAEMIGEIMSQTIPGKLCLDIGCGILARPSYHAPNVTFIGIDPYKGKKDREFAFVQGKAESLPFGKSIFNACIFATSLNHLEDPKQAIHEARRVLKRNGYLFIWNGMNNKDKSHLWAFDKESIIELTGGFKLIDYILVRPKHNQESIIIMQR